ncbi:uncharacterized protein LOC107640799 [Arachis ipaensis]|uniref:uncharacterized protein LOC107640799 n=1 Tax=Arachis ipaensis TaxID=130454 RepID=UPI0007AFBE09|nr:uncharacterized protein LOC107640799 [Arachis ipaensis]XP_025652716.1 uncharacterized protein LOC112748688 [Arachis hypogaea]
MDLVDQLHETLCPVKLAYDMQDRIVSKFDKEGIFSTNSFVQVMHSETTPEDITSYSFTRTIWQGLVPPRVELFIWFALIGKVNSKERLHRLGVISHGDDMCVLCKTEVEHVYHLFPGCKFTWQVWCGWLSDFRRLLSVPDSLKEHFETWTDIVNRKEDRNKRLICFFAVIWNVWLERNRLIFSNKEAGVEEVFQNSLTSYREWSSSDPFGG